jgi:xylan 1,4-beta-xylosidase
MKGILQLAAKEHVSLEGILTWAFEFENQPYFAGFRDLATNGIDKPVLNVFRMAGLMTGNLVSVKSSGAVPVDSILRSGVRQQADVDALATRSAHTVSVLVWNYHDDDVAGSASPVTLAVAGLPQDTHRLLLRHFRIDRENSNAYSAWKEMGSPQQLSHEQYSRLERAGQLHLLESPRWINSRDGNVRLEFILPLQGISLVQLSW